VPTTFGLKAAGWLVGVVDATRALTVVADALPAQLGGAAGTLASFGQLAPGRELEIVDAFAAELGLVGCPCRARERRHDGFHRRLPEPHHALRLGDIWSRPGLERRMRSAVTITALIAHGHLEELVMHIRAALTNGLTRSEIKEIILQSAIYCGVPAANSAFRVAQQVLSEPGVDELGADVLNADG
jgi:4-carboxymuconolactone decarboxylase